jgi:hypothetical protein
VESQVLGADLSLRSLDDFRFLFQEEDHGSADGDDAEGLEGSVQD